MRLKEGPLERLHTPLKTEKGVKSTIRLLNPKATTAITVKDDKEVEILIKEAVNHYVHYHEVEKSAKDQKDEAAEALRTYVGAVRDANAKDKDYQKTYRVLGKKDGTLQYATDVSQNDKYGIPKDADMDVIKKSLGDTAFNDLFQKETSISIKPEIMKNESMRKELSKILVEKLGMDGLKKYFHKEEVWSVKPGTDRKQYELSEDKREAFLGSVKASADTVKNATAVVKS